MFALRRPSPDEYAEYYRRYISLVHGEDFYLLLQDLGTKTPSFLSSLTPDQWDHRYEEGKWSIKEVVIHLLDAERVFAYRALRIARGDETPLPGFDQDVWVPYYRAHQRSPESIVEEYRAVRAATLSLFGNLSPEDYARRGTASDSPFTPLSAGYIIAGHELHHLAIIRDRYLGY